MAKKSTNSSPSTMQRTNSFIGRESDGGSAVILHVYDFQPDISQQQQAISTTDRALLMFSSVLPKIGMGAYHTSLELRDLKYTFQGGTGIIAGRANEADIGVPQGARYSTSIRLGLTKLNKQQCSEVLKRLSVLFFTAQSYDLIHRNCNHFTETFATALLIDPVTSSSSGNNINDTGLLEKFPKWLNRLAKTGALVSSHANEDVSSPCNVIEEARIAAGY